MRKSRQYSNLISSEDDIEGRICVCFREIGSIEKSSIVMLLKRQKYLANNAIILHEGGLISIPLAAFRYVEDTDQEN